MCTGLAQSHMPLHSTDNFRHEIQQQQQVSESRTFEAAVKTSRAKKARSSSEGATVKTRPSQERQQRQQPPQRQLQQQAEQPLRNDFGNSEKECE